MCLYVSAVVLWGIDVRWPRLVLIPIVVDLRKPPPPVRAAVALYGKKDWVGQTNGDKDATWLISDSARLSFKSNELVATWEAELQTIITQVSVKYVK